MNKKMTKSQINEYYVNGIMEEFEGKEINEKLAKEIVKAQAEMFVELLEIHLAESKKCPGQFSVPGLFTVKVSYKPAVRAGEKEVRNPSTGEMMPCKKKPESVKVRIIPMKGIKDIALSGVDIYRQREDKKTAKKKIRPIDGKKVRKISSDKTRTVKRARTA